MQMQHPQLLSSSSMLCFALVRTACCLELAHNADATSTAAVAAGLHAVGCLDAYRMLPVICHGDVEARDAWHGLARTTVDSC